MSEDMTSTLETPVEDISEQDAAIDVGIPDDEQQTETEPNELEALRARVAELKQELERSTAELSKSARQLEELYSLFPDSDVRAFPDSVWQSVSEGNSLAAAYALHLCREKQRADAVSSVNKKNAALSAGFAGEAARGEYFTPSEVRAMSQSEVRANYTKIIESMKRWN